MTETRSTAWSTYAANNERPWNLRRVHHLHRRAGFAAIWPELQRDLADGPDMAIQRILTGGKWQKGIKRVFDPRTTSGQSHN